MRRSDLETIFKSAMRACGIIALVLSSRKTDRDQMLLAARSLSEASDLLNKAVAEEAGSI